MAQGAKVPQPRKAGPALIVDIMAENVTNMYGAEFRLKYDPAVLRVVDALADKDGVQILPGSLLPADKGFVVANQVNEAEGTAVFALTLLRPAEPVNGGGPLARITFDVLQDQPSAINVEHAQVVAIDPANREIARRRSPVNWPPYLRWRTRYPRTPAGRRQCPGSGRSRRGAAAPLRRRLRRGESGDCGVLCCPGPGVLGWFLMMGGINRGEPHPAGRHSSGPARPSAFNPVWPGRSAGEPDRSPGKKSPPAISGKPLQRRR